MPIQQQCQYFETYQAQQSPKCVCLACWTKWVTEKPKAAAELLIRIRMNDTPNTKQRRAAALEAEKDRATRRKQKLQLPTEDTNEA